MKTATFFQNRSTSEIARDLLGRKLTYQGLGGYIVETEAYLGVKDRAAHSYGGHRSPANEGLYCRAGSLYIYAQRQYFFFDIATQKAGEPQGVLVRAIEPAQGQEQMEINRHGKKGVLLTNGPAKLMQALGINSRRWDCHFLEDSPFAIDLNHKRPVQKILTAPRIGIKQNDPYWAQKKLRFYVAGNPYVSDLKKRNWQKNHGWAWQKSFNILIFSSVK